MDPRSRAAKAVAAEIQRQQGTGGPLNYERIACVAIDAFSAAFETTPESIRDSIARVEAKLMAASVASVVKPTQGA